MIATNLDFEPEEVVKWYDARGEYSENRIKELKCGFSMERMPSSFFKANAIFFSIGCLAYNLFLKVRNYAYSIFKEIRYKTWIFCCDNS